MISKTGQMMERILAKQDHSCDLYKLKKRIDLTKSIIHSKSRKSKKLKTLRNNQPFYRIKGRDYYQALLTPEPDSRISLNLSKHALERNIKVLPNYKLEDLNKSIQNNINQNICKKFEKNKLETTKSTPILANVFVDFNKQSKRKDLLTNRDKLSFCQLTYSPRFSCIDRNLPTTFFPILEKNAFKKVSKLYGKDNYFLDLGHNSIENGKLTNIRKFSRYIDRPDNSLKLNCQNHDFFYFEDIKTSKIKIPKKAYGKSFGDNIAVSTFR